MPVITFVLNGAPVSIDADDDDEHGRGHVPLRHVLRHRRAVKRAAADRRPDRT